MDETLTKFGIFIKNCDAYMDKITGDIKSVEEMLRGCAILNGRIKKYPSGIDLYIFEGRLFCQAEDRRSPLMEHRFWVREEAHKVLNDFLKFLMGGK